MTNGFLGTICACYVTMNVEPPQKESAGIMISFMNLLGILLGSIVQIQLQNVIPLKY